MRYRSEIDGLRAVAVVPVVLFHAQVPWFDGGFVGVDVFFVISGYLITSILLEQLDKGTYSLASFYERRARRILPAFVVMMLTCLVTALIIMPPPELGDFLKSAIFSTVGLSNFYFLSQTGYFGPDADLQPLLHTWSLGIEEQYYFIFPPLLAYLTWRKRAHRAHYLVGLTLAGFAFAEVARHFNAERSFFFTLSRTWELGMGSLCAVYGRGRESSPHNLFGVAGLILIAASIVGYDRSIPFPSVYTLAPVIGTCLIILFASRETWVGRLLSQRLLVGIGLISYSTYLWHQPIFAFVRILSAELPSAQTMLGLSVISLLAGWISWRWIEQPFRTTGRPLLASRRLMLGASAASIIMLAGLGGLGLAFKEYSRMVWLHLHPEVAGAYLLREKADEDRDFGDTAESAKALTECRFNVSKLDDAIASKLDDCSQKFGPGVIVIGDSHAIDFFGVIASRFDTPYLVGITQHSCRVHDPEAECQFDNVLGYLSKTKGATVRLVVYTQAGFYLLQTASGGAVRRDFFENRAIGDDLPQTHPDAGRIEATLAYLEKLSQFTKVKWVGPRTEPHIPFNHFARVGCKASFTLRPGQAEAFASLDTYIEHRTAKSPKVSYASQNKIIEFDWARDYTDCKDLFFVDGDHYSEAGEIRFGRDLPSDFLN